jgi:hypothetical protein
MKNVHPGFQTFSVVILFLTFASLAHAQATRTWVSGSATAMDSPNTCTRTAPCKTFAYAISQTAAGGEIDALDPGDFGMVVINKAVTIDGTQGGGFASITVAANTLGILINAAATDVVTIRNLSINGNGSSNSTGIVMTGAGTVHIENCVVANHGIYGILDARQGSVNSVFYLHIKDTVSRNNGAFGGGIVIFPGYPSNSGVFIIASLTNVRSQDNNGFGVAAEPGTYASLDHCNITGNRTQGIYALGAPGGVEGNATFASVAVKNSVSSNNGTGVSAQNGAIVRISGVQIFDNTTGINLAGGGSVVSYGNNEINGNTTDGAPSSTIPQK